VTYVEIVVHVWFWHLTANFYRFEVKNLMTTMSMIVCTHSRLRTNVLQSNCICSCSTTSTISRFWIRYCLFDDVRSHMTIERHPCQACVTVSVVSFLGIKRLNLFVSYRYTRHECSQTIVSVQSSTSHDNNTFDVRLFSYTIVWQTMHVHRSCTCYLSRDWSMCLRYTLLWAI
jgi:hypothetical protein